MVVVISESERLENGSGKYPNPLLQIQIQMWNWIFKAIWIWKYPNKIILANINNFISASHLSNLKS
jgi:hypothetical protein